MCSACIHFSARRRYARPTRTCASCGLDRRIATGDTCINCYHSDIEAFVSNVASTRTAQLDVMRAFYRWARKKRRVLADPTSGLTDSRLSPLLEQVVQDSSTGGVESEARAVSGPGVGNPGAAA